MAQIKKYFLSGCIFIALFLVSDSSVRADVVLPNTFKNYSNSNCDPDETLVTCTYSRSKQNDTCGPYKSDARYRHLTDSGGATNSQSKYCIKTSEIPDPESSQTIIQSAVLRFWPVGLGLVGVGAAAFVFYKRNSRPHKA